MRNAGIGGEVAETTLPRLQTAIKSGWPQLVIWQVGTNDALVGVDAARVRSLIEVGVNAARVAGAPIVLIDPQYTIRETSTPKMRPYAEIVDAVGAAARVPVAQRYLSMQALAERGALAPLFSKDGLHEDDLGYDCLAVSLANLIDRAPAPQLAHAGQP